MGMAVDHGHHRNCPARWKDLVEYPRRGITESLPCLHRLEQQSRASHTYHFGVDPELLQAIGRFECLGNNRAHRDQTGCRLSAGPQCVGACHDV
ncbi:Uncharacterised protein [Mycobacterium tuberculosis]|nr:Uncharacterised protein [Mycobacterium tuberculosis]